MSIRSMVGLELCKAGLNIDNDKSKTIIVGILLILLCKI
jgi:hypothetical protein